MAKICSIVGARPQFIKADPVSRALSAAGHQEVLIHTGQHYDHAMSGIFFEELEIMPPAYSLGVGSGSHGAMTGQMLAAVEAALLREQPALVLVYGDTNSTLAGALAAAKLGVPIAHVEAGERSYDRRMPEEINRVVADSVADHHYCVSRTAVERLAAEGVTRSVHHVGDVMLDVMLRNLPRAQALSDIMARLELRPGAYALVTVHRAGNTDDPARLGQIAAILNGAPEPVVFPVHPRTRGALGRLGVRLAEHVRLIEPVGYLDMLALEQGARLIATDSGGVQREAYCLKVPCLVLRETTEWVEAVETGWTRLVDVTPEVALAAWRAMEPPVSHPPIFGDGTAGAQIVALLTEALANKEHETR
ncbi:MAG: UDP-N-acetylglucosamine 2-epimerase (non-hydrolyzing) [Chloroflexales bacterium]|nr:UDP-N-acetylglucosamine 2-epimerase (non-hydrolyzing) [Chloroflexales bacterium]